MAYARISVDKVFLANPEITVLDLAAQAAEDHSRDKGCVFEPEAGKRAVEFIGFDPRSLAKDLSEHQRKRLAHALEALEIECAGEDERARNVRAFVEAGEMVQAISATDQPLCDHLGADREAMEGRPLFGDVAHDFDGNRIPHDSRSSE